MDAGTVPVYWGAPDIHDLVPSGAFVDMRNFDNYNAMFDHINNMSDQQWLSMREIGRNFLQNRASSIYCDSLLEIVKF